MYKLPKEQLLHLIDQICNPPTHPETGKATVTWSKGVYLVFLSYTYCLLFIADKILTFVEKFSVGAATKQFIQQLIEKCPGDMEEKKARVSMVEDELKEGYVLEYIV